MILQNVVDMAVKSELSNLNIKDDNEAIVSFINLGVIELYKRFRLEVKEHMVELQDNVEIYDMPDDFMSLVAAYGEVEEPSVDNVNPLPVNVEDDPLSVNTVNWYQVQIPVAVTGGFVSLMYASAPPYLSTDDLDSALPIPIGLVEALLHYVGYRAHAAMDGSIQAENNTHYQRFEASCQRAKLDGVITADDVNMGTRIESRGFA